MNKYKRWFIGIAVLIVLLGCTEAVFAEDTSYPVTVWCADDMEVGATNGINGLEFMQPTGVNATKVKVTNKGRHNDVGSYDSSINTGGYASMLNAYVPKTRALKFTVAKPCDISIYAFGGSDSDVNMKISRSDMVIGTYAVGRGELEHYKAYLDAAGTYYIYSTMGALAVCEVKVGFVKGDIDADFDVDWNDLRLEKKAIYSNNYDKIQPVGRADISGDGVYGAYDVATLLQMLISDPKAQFVNNISWNVSNISEDNDGIFNKLELVYKDCDITNGSIEIKNVNKEYISASGEKKTFTKCISTDGEVSKGKGNYPVTKAVKFNLDRESYCTIYMSTGSTKAVEHKAQLINADGELVQEFSLTRDADKYSVKLEGNETYFISSSTGTLRIYEIDLVSELNSECSKTIKITANNSYHMFLTVDRGVLLDKKPIKLKYNNAALTLDNIGGSSANKIGVCKDGTKITEVGTGYIVFVPFGWQDGESGIMTDVTFKAKTTGDTTLTLGL